MRGKIRRSIALVAAMAALAGTAVLGVDPASAAPPSLNPTATTVARGGRLPIAPTGCDPVETPPGSNEYVYRYLEAVLITQTPSGEVLASEVRSQDPDDPVDLAFTVPGWVDAADPAVIVGRCREYREGPDGFGERVLFTYPEVAIDVTPGSGTIPAVTFTLDRTTAAGGQVITVSGSGCQPNGFARVFLAAGADRSGREPAELVTGRTARVEGGSFTVELPLLGDGDYDEELDLETQPGALAEGPYTVRVGCFSMVDPDRIGVDLASSQVVQVVGTNPSSDIDLRQADDDSLLLSGSGCAGGRTVTVRVAGYAEGELGEFLVESQRSRRTGRAVAEDAAFAPDPVIDELLTVTPDADGAWSLTWTPPAGGYEVQFSADCGDPSADGFRYVPTSFYESNWADLYLDRVSPTAAPVGSTVTVHGEGECDEAATLRVLARDGRALSSGTIGAPNTWGMYSGTVVAPSSPGRYLISLGCGDKLGYPDELEVFAPTPVARTAPLPADPAGGWPSSGARETYRGKIGPISLPVEGMDEGGERALGPSGLFIDVPRPAGDFAITQLSFDLVDGSGTRIPTTDAHLHHFVIGNRSSSNPACPGSTFGLPGDIVGAAGAERTVLDFADPYGKVVQGTDQWAGVYDLMNMSGSAQTVYLTYDIEYRRDVQNVRPVTTYFGSATGCSRFTWTVDGSGTADVQSTYVTMKAAGRLIGTGGHIHNGGLYSSLVDDRDREVCRSTISFGEGSGHHGHSRTARDVTAPTSVPGGPTEFDYPQEMYDDDPPIAGITGCATAESVKAGQRFRFDAVYDNLRARSGVMGIYTMYVWEGGGPADPAVLPSRTDRSGTAAPAGPAIAVPGRPNYAG